MEAVVVILRNGRSKDKTDQVLFIDAVDLVSREKSVSFINTSQQEEILQAYLNFSSIENLASLRTIKEIEDADWSLSIQKFVKKELPRTDLETFSLRKHFENWTLSTKTVKNLSDDLLVDLKGLESPNE